jgi:hypothetical protein
LIADALARRVRPPAEACAVGDFNAVQVVLGGLHVRGGSDAGVLRHPQRLLDRA